MVATENLDPYADDFDDDGECWNCNGEGLVYSRIDGFCDDAESGCDLCGRRCDVCNPATTRNSELDAVMSDALAAAGDKS